MKHKLDTIGREEVRRTNCVQLATTDLRSADRILADIYRKDPVRAAIASTYLLEMRAAIREIWRVLSVGGYFVLVAAIGAVKREGSDYIDLRGRAWTRSTALGVPREDTNDSYSGFNRSMQQWRPVYQLAWRIRASCGAGC